MSVARVRAAVATTIATAVATVAAAATTAVAAFAGGRPCGLPVPSSSFLLTQHLTPMMP
jgi:hypothetical protein